MVLTINGEGCVDANECSSYATHNNLQCICKSGYVVSVT